MKMLAKQLMLAVAAFALLIAGCSKKEEAVDNATDNTTAEVTPVTLKVGATPVPHVEILEVVKPILAEQGVTLEIVPFTDYVQPNLALDKGELDANFFQHAPYLEAFAADHGLNLKAIAKVHIEPMGIYSAKATSLSEIGDKAIIAIPNDPTNGGRALALAEKAGLIKLTEGVGVKATLQDIVSNPKKIEFKALDAAQLPRVLADVTAAVINTNFALEGGLDPKSALILEDKESPYANVLVVKADRAQEEALQKLATALTSEAVKTFIEEKYQGAVVPAQELLQ